MTIILIVLLALSVFMILFGHMILSFIDQKYIYPKRLAALQPPIPEVEPLNVPPEDLPPAIVSMICGLHSMRSPKRIKRSTRFTVTLLDLIHRGKIKVMRDGKKLYLIPNDDPNSDLRSYERILLEFVKDAARTVDHLSVAKLKGYIEVHRECAADMRSRFMQEMMSDFQSRGYYDELKRKSPMHPLALIGGIAVLASVGALLGWLASNIPLGVITCCFAGFAGWLSIQVFTYDIPFFTKKGARAFGEWDAYRHFIQSIKNGTTQSPAIEQWNRIAVYAAALEANLTFHDLTKIWKNLPEHSLECELYDPYFFKKLSEIDYAILISNVESIDSDLLKHNV